MMMKRPLYEYFKKDVGPAPGTAPKAKPGPQSRTNQTLRFYHSAPQGSQRDAVPTQDCRTQRCSRVPQVFLCQTDPRSSPRKKVEALRPIVHERPPVRHL